jgi:hypothetical protein
MFIFILTALSAFFLGYLYGNKIKPNKQMRKALNEVQEKCKAVLEEGNKGIYRTIVTDNNQSSELTVEVKELAITKNGHVKVQYLSAFYKNPEFRTKKGEALLTEVHGLLGEYLPFEEIEWYDNTERHNSIRNYLNSLNSNSNKQIGA